MRTATDRPPESPRSPGPSRGSGPALARRPREPRTRQPPLDAVARAEGGAGAGRPVRRRTGTGQRGGRRRPGLVDPSGGALGLASGVRVDVREFRDWAKRVLDPTVAVDAVMPPDMALRGELLPGWYEDWVLLERERLRQLRLYALEALAEELVYAGPAGGPGQHP